MKLSIFALAALLCVPLPASAALNLSPSQIRTAAIAAGVLATGAIIYNNERIHHRADNAKNDAINQALYEHNQRVQQPQQVPSPPQAQAQPQIVQPAMYSRYICVELDSK